MTGLASASSLLLAVTFAWAGASKLVSGPATRTSFTALGVPAAGSMARLVPVVELALAAGLVVAPRPAAVGTAALLAAFSVVLARAVARGLTVGCRCFGGAGSAPVSSTQLIRNAALVIAAGIATRTEVVRVPPIEAVVVVSCAALLVVVGIAAADLRRDMGAFWSVALAGEAR